MKGSGGMTSHPWLDRLVVLVTSGTPQAPHGHDFSANLLHVDEDSVCPVCLRWITPYDVVRRTAYGPAQHEVCPPTRAPRLPLIRTPSANAGAAHPDPM